MVEGGKRWEGNSFQTMESWRRKKFQVLVHWRFKCIEWLCKSIVAKARREGKKMQHGWPLGLTYFNLGVLCNLIRLKLNQLKYNATISILNNLGIFSWNPKVLFPKNGTQLWMDPTSFEAPLARRWACFWILNLVTYFIMIPLQYKTSTHFILIFTIILSWRYWGEVDFHA
jgi:hypothetical protein